MSRVIVLSGGDSTEHEVSLASGADVAESLSAHHRVMPIRIDRGGMWWMEGVDTAFTAADILDELEPDDVVFPESAGPVSAPATAGNATINPPTPRATANAPTRPT